MLDGVTSLQIDLTQRMWLRLIVDAIKGINMRPKELQNRDAHDLFRSWLDQIVVMSYQLAKLARVIDRGFLDKRFNAVYTDASGRPLLPTRLMAGMVILKYLHDLSDEVWCERWVETPYYQLFCGEVFF